MSDQTHPLWSGFADWLEIPKKRQRNFLFQLLFFYLLVVLILFLDTSHFRSDVSEGMVCPKTIRSPRNISFVDEQKTNELRRFKEEEVKSLVKPIKNAVPEMIIRMNKFLGEAERYYSDFNQRHLGEEDEKLIASYFSPDLLINSAQIKELLSLPRSEFERLKQTSIQILKNLNQQDITTSNLDAVTGDVKKHVDPLPGGYLFKRLLGEMVRNGLTVNAIEDIEQTRIQRDAAAKAVVPVKRTYQKGQKIIDEGVVVTADDINVLKAIEQQIHKNLLLAFLGNTLLTGLIIIILLLHLRLIRPTILKDASPFHLLGGLWIAALLFGKLVYAFGSAYDQSAFSILLSPLPSIGLLMAILLDSQIAIFHQMLLGILLFAIAEGNAKIAILSLLGGVIGILAWSFSSKSGNIRHQIGWSGVTIGVANTIVILALLVLDSENFAL
ncbi:hypothetical protein HYY75_05045, partial [bacterium]|nr:hypothetical protein [bacterium]